MMKLKTLLNYLILLISLSGSQALYALADYDMEQNILQVPKIDAGDFGFFNVSFKLSAIEPITFDIQSVMPVEGEGTSDGVFDLNSGLLAIDAVAVGTDVLSVTLKQQAVSDVLRFELVAVNGQNITADNSGGEFVLTSPAIESGELLQAYKCERKENGIEKSIPLAWSNVPAGTQSLAVTMHHFPNPNDSDASRANSYLTLWGIDPAIHEIAHGEADDGSWFIGANKDGNSLSYTSPCSPSAGVHEYVLTLYALSETPAGLPMENSLDVNYAVLLQALGSVEVIATTTLVFNDVNP